MKDMNSIIPENEYTEFEDRLYVNPQTGVDETNTFIEKLRETQAANNAQIAQQTQALGTEVPSSLGGLTGADSYFTSRYQTPQTASVVANLRATAQAAALNEALANEQAMWKKRYNDAYKAYQKSIYDKSNGGGGGGGGNGGGDGNESTWDGETKLKTTEDAEEEETSVVPPNPYSEEYNISGEEQTKRLSERSGLPEWLVNQLKIITNP